MTSKEAYRTLPIGIALLKDADNLQRWNEIMAGNLLDKTNNRFIANYSSFQIQAARTGFT